MRLLWVLVAIIGSWNSYAMPFPVLYGGTPVSEDDPIKNFVVRVANSDTWTTCAGVVIDRDVVLTAKHCVAKTVAGVEISVEPAPGRYVLLKAKAYLLHDKADIAMIRTQSPLPGKSAVELLDPGFVLKEGMPFLAVAHENDGTMTKLDLVSLAAADPSIVKISQTPGHGVCFGDSGGPLFYVADGEKLLLTGIASAVGDADCGQYSIFVKPQFYWQWVKTSARELHNRR